MQEPHPQPEITVIGGGAMGGAVMEGLLRQGMPPAGILLVETDQQRRTAFEKRGIAAEAAAGPRAGCSQVIVVAVKPSQVCGVLRGLSGIVSKKNIIVSVAAGVSLAHLESCVGRGIPCARTMPNIAARVGQAAVGICFNESVSRAQADQARSVMESSGTVVEIDESAMDAVTGLSGSGPAYVCLLVEALADAGVLLGLPRARALELALQTVRGTAELLLQTGEHPALMREAVTSPGGTTARGLLELEKHGFRNAVIEAVKAARDRAGEMSRGLDRDHS